VERLLFTGTHLPIISASADHLESVWLIVLQLPGLLGRRSVSANVNDKPQSQKRLSPPSDPKTRLVKPFLLLLVKSQPLSRGIQLLLAKNLLLW
jgi:hypothetical protein